MIPRLITSGLFCLAASATMNADFAPYDLRCEQLIDPIGIESPTPRLGWKCHSDSRDFTQRACRILVASDPSGSFTCSNPLFNKIHTLIDWAVRSNTASVLTDCPHREKLGWQEEAHLAAISEHGIPLQRGNIKGIRTMGTSGDKTRLHIGSGSYSFRVPQPKLRYSADKKL